MKKNLIRRSAFTLIELLTVIAIIGILAAILIPVVGKARDSARTSKCVGQVHAIAMAYHTYPLEHDGRYPATGNHDGSAWDDFWTFRIMDYMDFPGQDAYRRNQWTYGPKDAYFWCPAEDDHHGIADYGPSDTVIAHSEIVPRPEDIASPSSTVLIGEGISSSGRGTWWVKAEDFLRASGAVVQDGPLPPRHDGSGVFAFCDGHVETISAQRLYEEREILFAGPYAPPTSGPVRR